MPYRRVHRARAGGDALGERRGRAVPRAGLDELLAANLATGRLRFTTDHAQAARFADVHFLCVGNRNAAAASPPSCPTWRRR